MQVWAVNMCQRERNETTAEFTIRNGANWICDQLNPRLILSDRIQIRSKPIRLIWLDECESE